MAKQLVYVDDASIGATGDAGIVYDSGAGTLTTTKALSGTALTLNSTITGGAATDIALNTNKFTVDATQGNTVIAGTLTQTGAVAAAAAITLGAGADLIGSATSDITINTDKFTVAGATGNTVVAGTLTQTGAVAAAASITLGAGADLIGSATSDITINTDKFTVAGATGNTLVAGTCEVTGAMTQTGALACASTLSVAGILTPAVEVAQPVVCVAATNGAKVIATNKKLTTYVTNNTADIDASLADGEDGQELIVVLGTKDTNNVVITPAHMANGSTVTLDASAERVHFIFDGTSWHIVSTNGTVA